MATILFAPETINLAETTRMIETAKEVRKRGAKCLFIAYSTKFSHLIELADFEVVYLEPKTTEEMARNIIRFDQLKTFKNPFSKELMLERVKNEIALFNDRRIDKVVTGTSMSIFMSARISKVPLFYIKPFAYSRPHLENATVFKNVFLGATLQKIVLGLSYVPRMFKYVEKIYGVKVFNKTLEIFDGDYNLITSVPELTKATSLPMNYQHIGFMYAQLSGDLPK